MMTYQTFEERIGSALDTLYDGATLLTGDHERAEALVVSVVVDTARRKERRLTGEPFRRWIVGHMIRRYADYLEQSGASAIHDRGALDGDPAAWEKHGPALDETGIEGLLRNLETFGVSAEKLGRVVRAQMMMLSTRDRVALWLVNVLGFGYAEAAAALSIGRPELRQRLYRGRRELQARLALALRRELEQSPDDRRVAGAAEREWT